MGGVGGEVVAADRKRAVEDRAAVEAEDAQPAGDDQAGGREGTAARADRALPDAGGVEKRKRGQIYLVATPGKNKSSPISGVAALVTMTN